MMRNYQIAGHTCLPLLLGGCIYLLFRSESLLMFQWISRIHPLAEGLNRIRANTMPVAGLLPEWLVFSLPNALWLYSMLSFFYWIWQCHPKIYRYFFALIACAGIAIEFFQKAGLISGTFSWEDVAWAMALTLLFTCLVWPGRQYSKMNFHQFLI